MGFNAKNAKNAKSAKSAKSDQRKAMRLVLLGSIEAFGMIDPAWRPWRLGVSKFGKGINAKNAKSDQERMMRLTPSFSMGTLKLIS